MPVFLFAVCPCAAYVLRAWKKTHHLFSSSIDDDDNETIKKESASRGLIPTSTIMIRTFRTYHLFCSLILSALRLSSSFTLTNSAIKNTKLSSSTMLQSLASSGDVTTEGAKSNLTNFSTLSLLEHVNLNVPNHDYILEFYFDILGMGLDPRRAANVEKGSGTVWANCGASQFHLPFGEDAQVIPGNIGLRYEDLSGLKERLSKFDEVDDKPFTEYSINEEAGNVRIVDRYGNIFLCREGNANGDELIETAKQPVISSTDNIEGLGDIATKYGLSNSEGTDCKGVSYVEILTPRNRAEKIAEFYDCVFDATTSVASDPVSGDSIAIIGFGKIDENGRCSQSMLFRETDLDLPKYDGHHVAMYVGDDWADFEQAFKNVQEAGVLWVNPRFSDKVTNINTLKKWKQFRFKHIVDISTGRKIFELEHEIRSAQHESWPGGPK